jgi:hypothetical protein
MMPDEKVRGGLVIMYQLCQLPVLFSSRKIPSQLLFVSKFAEFRELLGVSWKYLALCWLFQIW